MISLVAVRTKEMLVIMVTLLLTFPGLVSAQLSSENFQVDSVSVGSTQSAAATSENFQTSQETGGAFTVDSDEGEIEEGSQAIGSFGTPREEVLEESDMPREPESVIVPDEVDSDQSITAEPVTDEAPSDLPNQTDDTFTESIQAPVSEVARFVEEDMLSEFDYTDYFLLLLLFIIVIAVWLLYRRAQ